ncbi:hypothetical protein ALC62_05374 [Cyphomyrmex costatus]|uniref:Uncharacterized protein n=1 Tax=Cyphomyrmex costatus TaxID=456900 RepID=A0A195CSJ0_9HYME|nr:hypothetical protein ALC62_05374 [Cyphomyrmex costatus]
MYQFRQCRQKEQAYSSRVVGCAAPFCNNSSTGSTLGQAESPLVGRPEATGAPGGSELSPPPPTTPGPPKLLPHLEGETLRSAGSGGHVSWGGQRQLTVETPAPLLALEPRGPESLPPPVLDFLETGPSGELSEEPVRWDMSLSSLSRDVSPSRCPDCHRFTEP